MKVKYDFINFSSDFPIRISLKKVTNHEKDWHTTIKLIYVMEGFAEISYNDTKCNIKTDDIVLINPWTIYEINAMEEIVYIDFEINMSKYLLNKNEYESVYFECNSALDQAHLINYKILKSCILGLIKINTQYKSNKKYINASLAYQILYVLMEQFKVEGYEANPKDSKHFNKLRQIIDYVSENYDKNLTLNDVASNLGYTPQYFSSFFSKHMNQTFQNYYDSFRISTHFSLLESSDYPLEEIAYKCGFADYRSYIRAFKNIYKLTPSEYRKTTFSKKAKEELSFDRKHYLDVIFNHKIKSIEEMRATIDKNLELQIDFSKKGEPIRKTFMNVFAISKASDLLKENVRETIRVAHKAIPFKMLRFHDIFSDDLHVYRKFMNGTISYSFVFIDQILDFLMSLSIKPFIELGFMPRDLAKNKSKIVFESRFITSEPESNEAWCGLVKEFINHLIYRYGKAEVESWPISIWSEPDSTTHAFGFSTDELFYSFYDSTYKAIKAISNKISVGSPNLIPFASWAPEWDKRFLEHTMLNGTYPDFLQVSYYSNDFDFFITGKKIEKMSKDPDNLREYIKKIKSPSFYRGDKIYLSNWNLTSSQRNYLNDTLFSASYLVKNILENMDSLESFTKWGLTDFMDEAQIPDKLYHGGVGMFTYNGVPKASFEALRLLSRLKGTMLAKGMSYYVTKDSESIQIITYNYEHYCDLYADGEYFTIKDHSRYDPFMMNTCNKFKFHFDSINYNKALIKVTSLAKDSGSSYDIHENISYLDPEGSEEINDLIVMSKPKYKIYKDDIINGSLDLAINCSSLEIKLIEIKLYNENKV